MRVRIVLLLGTVAVLAALALDMSGSAPRTAGSDHFSPLAFTATLTGGQSLCQPVTGLPADAARVQFTAGSYGRPLPALTLRFEDALGRAAAEGVLPAGAREGVVSVPIAHRPRTGEAAQACIAVARHGGRVALAGEGVPPSAADERIGSRVLPARLSLYYFRRGRETWWQLLPTLARRIGLGKAEFLGSWLLPVLAVGVGLLWAGTLRLLSRELA